MIKTLGLKVDVLVNHKKKKLKAKFTAVWIAIKWKRARKKWGSSRSIIDRQIIRRQCNIIALSKYDGLKKKSLEILKAFLLKVCGT